MPAPPLVDAPVYSLISNFRGCVGPVTVSINDTHKMLRHNLELAILAAAVIYIFCIIPFKQDSSYMAPI
jgi:hypothetical protein